MTSLWAKKFLPKIFRPLSAPFLFRTSQSSWLPFQDQIFSLLVYLRLSSLFYFSITNKIFKQKFDELSLNRGTFRECAYCCWFLHRGEPGYSGSSPLLHCCNCHRPCHGRFGGEQVLKDKKYKGRPQWKKNVFFRALPKLPNPPPWPQLGQLGPLFLEVEIQDLKVILELKYYINTI